MRLAVIAPEEDASIYRQAVARMPNNASGKSAVSIDSFVHELDKPEAIDRLLGRPLDFDACTMLSPNPISREQLFRLAELDKSVLVASSYTTIEMLRQMSARWQQSQGLFMVAQPQRFGSYARTVTSELMAEKLGQPGLVRIHRWLPMDDDNNSPHIALWNATTNEVDLASSLFQATPDMIYAQPVRGEPNRRGILVHLGFQHGMAIIDCMSHPVKGYYSLSVVGANGTAYADDHHNTNLLLKDKTLGIAVANNSNGIHVDWLRPQLEAFVAAIEDPSRKPTQSHGSVVSTTNAMQISRIAVQCAQGNRSAKRQGDQYELQ